MAQNKNTALEGTYGVPCRTDWRKQEAVRNCGVAALKRANLLIGFSRLPLRRVAFRRNCVRADQTACRCFSERVLKSPCVLLSPVRSGAVVCRNQCGRSRTGCRGVWNWCSGVPDQMQRQMEQVLSPVGKSAEVSGTTAVARRNQCCRPADRVRRGLNPVLSCDGTIAVASRVECRGERNVCSHSSERMPSAKELGVGTTGTDAVTRRLGCRRSGVNCGV
jgi:hypothetical protein